MLNKILVATVTCIILIPGILFASGDNNKCATRYPVVLSHGMGTQSEIIGLVDYWWGIPDELEDNGAEVYITNVNGMDSTANKGEQWKQDILEILAVTGAAKLNVIGHSHGTIYTRYAISNLGMADCVATHTSLGGPHRGSMIADMILGLVPDSLEGLVGDALNLVYVLLFGDDDPDSLQNGYDLTRDYMINVFNPNTPDMPGIYYQSWASRIKDIRAGELLTVTWLAMLPFEGSNDGLVSTESAKWGNFRGILTGEWWCGGVNHLHQVNQFLGYTPGFDSPGFFVNIVSELKDWGY